MKANERALLAACINTGIDFGWRKAHKHTDNPNEHAIGEQIENAIWYEIDQYFDLDTDRNLFDEVMEGLDDREARREALYELVKMDMFKASSKLEGIDYDKKREWVGLTDEETQELLEALEEAVYLLNPTDKDMQEKAGVYRVVTALEKLKGRSQ